MYFLFFFPINTELQQEEPKENSFLNFLQVIWVKNTISNKKVYFIIKKPQKSAYFSQKSEAFNSLMEISLVILDNFTLIKNYALVYSYEIYFFEKYYFAIFFCIYADFRGEYRQKHC